MGKYPKNTQGQDLDLSLCFVYVLTMGNISIQKFVIFKNLVVFEKALKKRNQIEEYEWTIYLS